MPAPILTTAELRERVAKLPRVDLAHLPTPLEEVPRFAERIGGVRVFVKRDDCTGLLFGGNKTRHAEFLMADALQKGCDMVVWGAGVQSNNCRQTAAACAKLGLECRLYLSRGNYTPDPPQGNLLLDYLVGAHVEIVDAAIGTELDALLKVKAEEFRRAGRKPYTWDRPTVVPLAAVSYALCLAEIVDEMSQLGVKPGAVYVSAAGSTGAGLVLGQAILGLDCPIRSVCPIVWPWDTRADMADTATKAARLLGLPHEFAKDDIEATEEFVAPGYGQISQAGQEAMRLLATTEGILLDPSYTAKAMAALIADVRSRKLAPGTAAVFVHTGGLPAVFYYGKKLLDAR